MPWPAADAEQLGQRLAEIGERRPRAEVDVPSDARAGDEQRHVLARVIGARRGRIVAVIGGDDQQIGWPAAAADRARRRSKRSRFAA